MHIEAAKVKPIKNASAPLESVTGDLENDVKLANTWLGFRSNIIDYFNNVESVAVELQFESSYDSKTHHTFNADEAVFVTDVQISPENQIIFIVPFGAKNKSFNVSESELMNAVVEGETHQLNNVISSIFKESFKEFKDVPSITLFERKYIAGNAAMAGMLNGAEEYVRTVELNKDRSILYTKLPLYGIF